jgi:pSer/pThr/pTyr-binding forkhead associated (FHA) protein
MIAAIGEESGATVRSAYVEAGASEGWRRITDSGSLRLSAASDGSGVRNLPGSGTPRPSLALRLLQGNGNRTVPLPDLGELKIGTEPGLDVVLPPERTSKRHARIVVSETEVVIEDLGSVGGTFVNGKRIAKKTALKAGDRILIGATIFQIEERAGTIPTAGKDESGRITVPPASPRPDSGPKRMSGLIEVVGLPDLLQLLAQSRKSGVLEIKSQQGTGRIHLREGRVVSCDIEDSPAAHPRKAVFRLLRWTEGAFELLSADGTVFSPEREMKDSIDSILMNGMCEMDEINRLDLGDLKPGMRIEADLAAGRLRDLKPEELDVLQTVLARPGTLENFLDHFPGTDLEAYTGLLPLLQKGFVVAR